ncbi:ATP-binding protein, partial [Bacillus cereus]
NEINRLISSTSSNLFSIEGGAGTGKTLLVYDFAKQYINMGKKVAIIHCGNLNEGHSKLISNHSWNIIHVREYREVLKTQFDLII